MATDHRNLEAQPLRRYNGRAAGAKGALTNIGFPGMKLDRLRKMPRKEPRKLAVPRPCILGKEAASLRWADPTPGLSIGRTRECSLSHWERVSRCVTRMPDFHMLPYNEILTLRVLL